MKSNTLTITALAVLIFASAIGIFALHSQTAKGQITADQATSDNRLVNYTFFATSTTDTTLATTTSGTSTNFPAYNDSEGRIDNGSISLAGAEKVTFYFSRSWGGGNAGASKFEVEVSPNCSTYYAYDKLVGTDVSSTATTSVTISAATSTVLYSMNLEDDAYRCARVKVTETTDGTHAAAATIQY